MIGATTRSGLLASPLRDRFGIFHHLDFYSPEDLTRIVVGSARKLGVAVEDAAALAIAQRARGTPRIANRLLRRVRDFSQVKTTHGRIDQAVVDQAMKTLGVDKEGLDEVDRRLLGVIAQNYNGGPVGIEALAATLNEEVDTLVDVIEPFLLKIGFLRRTSRGREMTEAAWHHVGLNPARPNRSPKELF